MSPTRPGTFYRSGTLATKVTHMGRERVMCEGQTSGDCNSRHPHPGAMKAPGRILMP
jgi:hypothetical protein